MGAGAASPGARSASTSPRRSPPSARATRRPVRGRGREAGGDAGAHPRRSSILPRARPCEHLNIVVGCAAQPPLRDRCVPHPCRRGSEPCSSRCARARSRSRCTLPGRPAPRARDDRRRRDPRLVVADPAVSLDVRRGRARADAHHRPRRQVPARQVRGGSRARLRAAQALRARSWSSDCRRPVCSCWISTERRAERGSRSARRWCRTRAASGGSCGSRAETFTLELAADRRRRRSAGAVQHALRLRRRRGADLALRRSGARRRARAHHPRRRDRDPGDAASASRRGSRRPRPVRYWVAARRGAGQGRGDHRGRHRTRAASPRRSMRSWRGAASSAGSRCSTARAGRTTCCSDASSNAGGTVGRSPSRSRVDHATRGWMGHVGVVTTLVARASFDPTNVLGLVCGPEVMMRFAVTSAHRARRSRGAHLRVARAQHEVRPRLVRPLSARPGLRVQGRSGASRTTRVQRLLTVREL